MISTDSMQSIKALKAQHQSTLW